MDSVRNSSSNSFLQLHPKTKPTQKRSLQEMEDWDNHQTYMILKKRKLQSQFDAMKTEGKSTKSAIFDGVTIYVNGWTVPSAVELKEMVYEHGGNYVYNLYGRSNVTHTIASNLPNSKILKIGTSIVCKPEWIVDSVAAKTKLPVEDYLLYRTQDSQTKLNFTTTKSIDPLTPCPLKDEISNDPNGNIPENEISEDLAVKSAEDGLDTTSNMVVDQSVSTRDAKKSEFVKEFFTHSRLHYLSTWSVELKQFLAEKLRSVTPKLPKLEPSDSLRASKSRAVVHIDLDCFFVSVSLKKNPHLRGKPVAVTHAKRGAHNEMPEDIPTEEDQLFQSNDEKSSELRLTDITLREGGEARKMSSSKLQESTSDIASCSYEARRYGISNGMSVGAAMKKCPDLILMSYDFEAYREVSQTFYCILLQYSSVIEAVSCDEAYVEFTDSCRSYEHVMEVVGDLRQDVTRETGCTVSAGVSHNMFLARMSTRVAKPDGQFLLRPDQVAEFLSNQRVRDLPGVGYSTAAKIQEMNITNCGELLDVSLSKLQGTFGSKFGRTLYDYARGVDSRELKTTTERKSISVDINFGIRYKELSEAESLVKNLAEELQRRADEAGVAGTHITLKMKIRKQDAPKETRKYMGHGLCDNVSRSMALLQPVQEAGECSRLALKLLKQVRPVVEDIRGMGLQLSKLVSYTKQGRDKRSAAQGGQQLLKFFKSETKQLNSVKEREVSLNDPLPVPNLPPPKTEKHLRKLGDPPAKTQSPRQTKMRRRRRRGGGTSAALTRKSPVKKSPKKSPAKASPIKSPVKSLKHYFKSAVDTKTTSATASAPDATNNEPVVATSSLPSKTVIRKLDESFALDLPPASQLDHAVLDALPSHLQEKIMKSYNDSTSKDQATLSKESPVDHTKGNSGSKMSTDDIGSSASEVAMETEEDEEVVVKNEEQLLKDWKTDILEWTESFCDGPTDDDVVMVASHFCKMANTNLKMVEVCLKIFRRFLVSKGLSAWCPCFNVLLEQIQGKVQLVYRGTLKIEPLASSQQSSTELSIL